MGTEAVIDSFAGFWDPILYTGLSHPAGEVLSLTQLALPCFVDIHGRPVFSCIKWQSG